MEEDWDNDDGPTGVCFNQKEFAYPEQKANYSEKSYSHHSRDRQSGSRDRNHRRSGSNRSREDDNSKKCFEIEGNQIGAFIGKGGANIRKYEEQFDVKLNLDKSSNTVTVTGDPNNVSEACDFIKQDLSNIQSRPRRDDFGSQRNGG